MSKYLSGVILLRFVLTSLVLFAYVTILGSPRAEASVFNKCIALFRQPTPERFAAGELQKLFNPEFDDSTESLKFIGEVPFKHGGFLRLIEDSSQKWGSRYKSNKADLIGSPLQFPIIVGPEVAAAFGFLKVTERTMYAPNATALMAVMAKLNVELKKMNTPFAIKFYETDLHSSVAPHQFLQKFVDGGYLPLERRNALGLHDISYHIANMLMPADTVSRMQASAKWSLAFAAYLRAQNNSQAHLVADAVIAHATQRIDYFGNLSLFLSKAAHHTKSIDLYASFTLLVKKSGLYLSPYDFIQQNTDHVFGSPLFLEEFAKSQPGQEIFNSGMTTPVDLLDVKLLSEVEKNIENLKKAVALVRLN
ncbi:MAG: hypothetical protein H7061_03480 [Bdellovibrionaceae bacterium]|nr:hypothetical protein [Bdellovibrio sp.]